MAFIQRAYPKKEHIQKMLERDDETLAEKKT